jgi:hypothetical protein
MSFTDIQKGMGTELSFAHDWSGQLDDWMATQAGPTIEIMSQESKQGRKLASRLKGIVGACRDEKVDTKDVVHGDFLATQLLVRDGRLSGVVDWDAAGRGDRCQDLALLFYNAFAQADRHEHLVDEEVVTTLAAHAMALCGPERFGWFLGYEILVTFAFVFEHNPAHVSWRTDLGYRVIDRYMQATGTGF